MARRLSQDEAVAFDKSGEWEELTPIERARYQLNQERLCMPLDLFHEGMEALLGRKIEAREFIYPDSLRVEVDRVYQTPAPIADKPWQSLQLHQRQHRTQG